LVFNNVVSAFPPPFCYLFIYYDRDTWELRERRTP